MTEIIITRGDENICSWKDALKCTGEALYEKSFVKDTFVDGCIKREEMFPTGLPCEEPVAIPHADAEYVLKDAICFLILKKPIAFRRMDNTEENISTRLVVNMAISASGSQVEMLMKLMNILKSKNDVLKIINEYNDEQILEFANKRINE